MRLFRKAGFIRPIGNHCGIFLRGYRNDAGEALDHLKTVLSASRDVKDGQQLLEVIPLEPLIEVSFYNPVSTFNFSSLKEKSLYLLDNS